MISQKIATRVIFPDYSSEYRLVPYIMNYYIIEYNYLIIIVNNIIIKVMKVSSTIQRSWCQRSWCQRPWCQPSVASTFTEALRIASCAMLGSCYM